MITNSRSDNVNTRNLVVDILLAPFDKFYKMAKVSPVERSAVWFHCKASLRGMLIGLVFAPVVGLIVMLI